MIGVDNEMQVLQVREGNDEVECLTGIAVLGIELLAVCGYGLQGRDTVNRKILFWEYLDKEDEDYALEDQALILQINSNCCVGSQLVP